MYGRIWAQGASEWQQVLYLTTAGLKRQLATFRLLEENTGSKDLSK